MIPPNLIVRNSCRVCSHTKLDPILSLGVQYITNFVDSTDEEYFAAPLELVLCNISSGGCGLLQLKHTVPSELLFRKFWYKSGINQTMRDALTDVVTKAEKLVKLQKGEIVVDIGSNDSTLLRAYCNKELLLVGFEPATNLMDEARLGTTKIINDFFSYEAFHKEFGNKKAKIITAIAMFYDLEDPNKFVEDVARTLDNDGVFIIQMNYLVTMLKNNTFDNISHEHLEYYSLKTLEHLLDRHGLVVFDVEFNDLNGGSIRTYIKHKDCKDYPITAVVKNTRIQEERMGLDSLRAYQDFAKRIQELKQTTYDFIRTEVEKGKSVYVYGASTRGNTLLQFYNLDHRLIKAAADRNPAKWGKRTVATLIPIISEEQARAEKPDYFLILPWAFLAEFKNREREYLLNGGKFIVPLPNFRVIDSSDLMEDVVDRYATHRSGN